VHIVSVTEHLPEVADLWPTPEVAHAGEATALRLTGLGALRLGLACESMA